MDSTKPTIVFLFIIMGIVIALGSSGLLETKRDREERLANDPKTILAKRSKQDIVEDKMFLADQDAHHWPTLLKGARMIWMKRHQCLEVTDGDLRPKQYQEKDNPAFFVTCKRSKYGEYANYYFTKRDIDRNITPSLPEAILPSTAKRLCVAKLKPMIKFPSSLKIVNVRHLPADPTSGNMTM